MPSLTQMREEFDAKAKNLHDLFAKYPEVTDMPEDDAKKVAPMNSELTTLKKAIEEAEELVGAKKLAETRLSGTVPEVVAKGQQAPAQGTKSVHDIIAESKAYEAFRKGEAKTATFEFPQESFAPEAKTLLTLTTMNSQPLRLPGITNMALDETTVADLMLQGSISTNTLTYFEETTHTHAAAAVTEGAAKPEAAFAFTERTENIRKLAVWIPATTEFLEDLPAMQSWIEGRLRFQLQREEEDQLLNGDGTAPNISGIMDRSIQTQALGADPVPDAVYKAMTKVRVTGLAEPTAYVTHPNDWQAVRLLTTTDGIYLWGSPADAGPERIWGLNVRVTPLIAENTGLVGAFRPFAQVFRRGPITVKVSTEHDTYFTENKVAILAEERLGLAVYRATAFCSVTGI